MYKVISLYNNKGGVSKTTTAFNIGVYLSEIKKKKVLIIDADPQCNITELMLAADKKVSESTNAKLPGTSILDALKPRLEGSASKINVSDIEFYKSKLYPKLHLLRGDIEFSAVAESYFANSVSQSITNNVNEKNTYLCIRRLTRDLIDKKGFNYIIIDVGPSSGAITRLALLACDGYFLPVTPDRFCYLAINSLAKIFKEWFEQDNLILKTLEPFGIESNFNKPVFLGAINQNYQVYKSKAKASYSKWSTKIKTQINDLIIKNRQLIIEASLKKRKNPFVCEIQDLGPLAPVSQMSGKAVFDLSQEDTRFASSDGNMYYGSVWDNWVEKMAGYKKEISKIEKVVKK